MKYTIGSVLENIECASKYSERTWCMCDQAIASNMAEFTCTGMLQRQKSLIMKRNVYKERISFESF